MYKSSLGIKTKRDGWVSVPNENEKSWCEWEQQFKILQSPFKDFVSTIYVRGVKKDFFSCFSLRSSSSFSYYSFFFFSLSPFSFISISAFFLCSLSKLSTYLAFSNISNRCSLICTLTSLSLTLSLSSSFCCSLSLISSSFLSF